MPPAMKKGPPPIDLAVIMGGPGGGKKPPMGDDPAPDSDDEAMGDMVGEESNGAFDAAYEEFTDESLAPEDRKAAFKRAVMACMGGDY